MHLPFVLALSAILLCDAKLPKKQHIQPNELPANPTQNEAAMRLIQVERKSERTSKIVDQYRRSKREIFDSMSYESGLNWAHSERLDEFGDVVLRWVNSDSSITFRVEAKTLGYVGLGFNSVGNMRGADLVVAWVDDRNGNARILDCHGPEHDDKIIADDVQDYELISAYQNKTHTCVEFRRPLHTCDKQDFAIEKDTTQILWALGPPGSDGELPKHVKSGSRPLNLLQPVSKPESIPLKQWDIRLDKIKIPHIMATLFWCKIFKTPELASKHHIVGYEPIIDSHAIKDGAPLKDHSDSTVHHMVLYECEVQDDDQKRWDNWSEGDEFKTGIFGPNKPSSWSYCATPIAAWAMGSKGEFLPENVGIPLGEKGGVRYYMLEVHYDNKLLHEVLDSSGIRLHYTPALRRHDAGLMATGITISPLHFVPPAQTQYKTIGICSAECSEGTLPEDGINIVSVLLHAHGTAKKISLKHVRGNKELPRIAEENSYDVRYQQSRVVPGGRKFQKGDVMLTECTYDTTSRDKLIMGGYSDAQEMCLSFVLYYPRTALAGCYSMSPVKEFFETFGIRSFYGLSFERVENILLFSRNVDNPPASEGGVSKRAAPPILQGDDQGIGLMKQLVIWEPSEFRNKSFMAHLDEMPWHEPLLTAQIQKSLYNGLHMTFCKKRDDSWAVPIQIQNYPSFEKLEQNETALRSCQYNTMRLPSVTKSATTFSNTFLYKAISILYIIVALR